MTSPYSRMPLPLIAILRGITSDHAKTVATTLYGVGVRYIEVTLNSPDPWSSIDAMLKLELKDCLIGAGTVLSVDDVRRTFDLGGRLIVTPNCNQDVISESVRLGMTVVPGIATATEAFNAVNAGARQLKLFPAVTYGCAHLKALKSVLPTTVRVFPVGGVGLADIQPWLAAGADGFGFGSELFRPDYSMQEIEQRATSLVQQVIAATR